VDRNNNRTDSVWRATANAARTGKLVTCDQAITLAHIARNGPLQGIVSYPNPHRRLVTFGTLNKTVIGQLSRMRLVTLDVSRGTLNATRLGLAALDELCETLWPETARVMDSIASGYMQLSCTTAWYRDQNKEGVPPHSSEINSQIMRKSA
jgi:hypothetical protein